MLLQLDFWFCRRAVASSPRILIFREVEEVNKNLPQQEQIEYAFMYPGKMKKIRIAYERFYPSGKIDRWRLVFQSGMSCFSF